MIYIPFLALIFFFLLVWLILEYGILIPVKKGLPILMYHKVSTKEIDGITITVEKLKQQFEYIREKGYSTITFAELTGVIKTGKQLPKYSLILTFDDAYHDFLENAFPLLKTYGFKATVFIPVGFIGKTNLWDLGSDKLLSISEIKDLANTGLVEFGIHSYLHRNYAQLDPDTIENDLGLCFQTLDHHNIPFVKVLAYPYGGYPKKDQNLKLRMKEIFRLFHLQFALRIGNSINRWPLKDLYEIKRIDIKGSDNFFTFRTKLRKGRRKFFS